MKKPWSITTTLRNPDRLRGFLKVLSCLDGGSWDFDNQKKFQILLIQNRLYGYGSVQFYNNLSKKWVKLLDDLSQDISFKDAESIFLEKEYEDPAMRGRQSINPLRKFGFVTIRQDGKVCITGLGKLFMQDDFDVGEVFLKSFLKWQIPNPDSNDYPSGEGYDIKPFVGVLHLIDAVNKREVLNGNEPKGLSKKEFALFAPTLIHYNMIQQYADTIIALRMSAREKSKEEQGDFFEKYKNKFAVEFLGTDNSDEVQQLLNNLKDYGDNAIRYFRLTKYLHIRGGGFYVDLEPRRSVEITSLLDYDTAQSQIFESKEGYLKYISDISQPRLPWETREKYLEVIDDIVSDIKAYEISLQKKRYVFEDYIKMDDVYLKEYIAKLRIHRKELQNEQIQKDVQDTQNIKTYIKSLEKYF